MIRRLTTLSNGFYNAGKWYVSFAYYDKDEFGSLEWNGDSESCEFTEDELYELVKPRLKSERTVLKRR